jgi:hypothetical protein
MRCAFSAFEKAGFWFPGGIEMDSRQEKRRYLVFLLAPIFISLASVCPSLAQSDFDDTLRYRPTLIIDPGSLSAYELTWVRESLKRSGIRVDLPNAESPLPVTSSVRYSAQVPRTDGQNSLVVQMSPREAELFVKHLLATPAARTLGREIYVGPTVELVSVSTPVKGTCTPTNQLEVPSRLKEELSTLKPGMVGKYYLIDYFRGPGATGCEHGEKVLEVARQTLRGYGGPALESDVIPVQANFFADKGAASKIVSAYIKTFRAEAIQKTLMSALDRLKKQSPPAESGKYFLSILYLQAIFHDLLSRGDMALVSTSIFGQLPDGFGLLPEKFYARKSDSVMLTAASDDPMTIEDTYLEPMRTFWQGRQEYGFAVVGAEDPRGPFGMTSRYGDGVAVLAPASGWSTSGSCFHIDDDCGTSFATPFIGAQVLLARAFWKSRQFKPSARDIIRHLLLAADVAPDYVGRYASGGVPRLEKIIRLDGVYAETLDGRIDLVQNVDCSIRVKHPATGKTQTYSLVRGAGGFSGIQFSLAASHQPRTFIFRDEIMKWEEVEVVSLSFTHAVGSGVATLDLEKFTQQFKELSLL